MSTDSPGAIRAGRKKHGLQATMISDSDLAVADLYGVRNQLIQSGPPGRPSAPDRGRRRAQRARAAVQGMRMAGAAAWPAKQTSSAGS